MLILDHPAAIEVEAEARHIQGAEAMVAVAMAAPIEDTDLDRIVEVARTARINTRAAIPAPVPDGAIIIGVQQEVVVIVPIDEVQYQAEIETSHSAKGVGVRIALLATAGDGDD